MAFTRTAAVELVNSGITVNAVSPGYTETDMFDAVPQALQTIIKGKIPMGRFAHPEEIAKAVLFLVADGDYITGQQINLNGGAFVLKKTNVTWASRPCSLTGFDAMYSRHTCSRWR